jgi:D-glycero-D-manno-heptose 1,7-bisphosphate phosphatase
MALIILDRDGVINEDSDDYIKSPEEWIAIPGSAEAIARLNQAGYSVVVATNQSGVGRGYFDLDTLAAIHDKLCETVESAGGHIDGIFFCPHAPEDHCDCRKPKPGLIDQIMETFDTDVAGCVIVGDSARDLECGAQRGCQPVLVKTGKGQRTLAKGLDASLGNVPVYDDLAAFVDALLTGTH